MWPFKKKEKKPKEKPWQIDAIKEMKEFRKIGETFVYRGIEMTVCGHYEFNGSIYSHPFTPSLRADYVDKHGILHNISFGYQELKALIEANS